MVKRKASRKIGKSGGSTYITSGVRPTANGKFTATYFVGTRTKTAEFDTKEEAEDFCKRNIDRELK